MYFLTAWLSFAKRDMLIVVYEKQEFILKKKPVHVFCNKKKNLSILLLIWYSIIRLNRRQKMYSLNRKKAFTYDKNSYIS